MADIEKSTPSKGSESQKTPKRSALGKGFNSLLGFDDEVSETEKKAPISWASESVSAKRPYAQAVIEIPVDKIEANPHQPRKVFHNEELQSLSESIKVDGVIQPIIVTPHPVTPDLYTLVAGERRWRASKLAGKKSIPAIVKSGQADAMLRVALIENIQRSDLSIIEEAEAYQSLIEDFGLTQEQCAQKVGKDRSTITNALRMLKLPREIQDDLLEKRLSMGHARALLTLEDKKEMLKARDLVIRKKLNVRQTELLSKKLLKQKNATPEQASSQSNNLVDGVSADLEYLAEALRSQLKTKVKLTGTSDRGRIEISYFSLAELERLLDALGVPIDVAQD